MVQKGQLGVVELKNLMKGDASYVRSFRWTYASYCAWSLTYLEVPNSIKRKMLTRGN